MSEKKYLGVEFYRNFVGIENPLMIMEHEHSIREFKDIDIIEDAWCINHCDLWDVKPYLRTIEYLSDEELIYIFTGQKSDQKAKYNYSIKRTETYIHLKRWEKDGRYGNSFHLIDMKFRECDEEILNRLYSTNSHPRAKEYIDNGLALRVEK